MTYRYRTREELHVLKNNEVEESVLAEFFAKEIHDLIYIEEDSGNLLGTISYSDFVSQRWRKGIVQSESNRQSMKDEEVEEYFLSHPTNSRLPDVLSGKLIGEYFLPYVAGEDVQCKYNKFAISWFVYYLNDIDDLNHQYEQVVENATTKTLLFADRFPFRYLLDDYDLNYYAAFPGCSADVEASFYTITFLANKIDQLDLKSIFVIDQTNLKIAQTVKDNTKKKNQKIMYLDSLQSVDDQKIKDGYSYLKAMKYNLKVLKKAL